jgi:hypothetical protein
MSTDRVADAVKETAAGAGTIASWGLWGWSLTQVNEFLTALSLLAATFASIAAGIYYLRKRRDG